MPENPPNVTQIPAPRVDFIDKRTGLMAREWYRFFVNIYNLAGGGNSAVSLDDLQVGQFGGGSLDSIAEMMKTLQDLELQPPVVPSGGTGTTYSVFTSVANGLAPASGGGTSNYLRADGTWGVPPGTGGGITDGDKGDIVVSGGATVWTVDAGVVTNSKLANVSTATFKGRTTAGSGSPEDLTGTQATALLDTFTTALKGLTPASGGGTTNFLRADGTWAVPSGGGGGSVGTATATIDFGSTPVAEGSFTITNAAITTSSYIQAYVMVDSTVDNDADAHKHAAASWQMTAEPGTGDFTLYVTSLIDFCFGTFKVRYTYI